MNCEKCLALIDDYLDEELNSTDSVVVSKHLEVCSSCAVIHADFTAILNCCAETRDFLETPPNPQALWLRISNLIESEQSALVPAEAKAVVSLQPKTSLWARSWQLSFQQMFSAVLGITVITSLLTIIGIKNASQFQSNFAAAQNGLFSPFYPAKNQPETRNIELENRLKQQQLAIEYWNRRVEARKNQWNKHLREAFDRNLAAIDGVVADYQQQLIANPDDKISEEMLDAALNDKMQLLREFSEL